MTLVQLPPIICIDFSGSPLTYTIGVFAIGYLNIYIVQILMAKLALNYKKIMCTVATY